MNKHTESVMYKNTKRPIAVVIGRFQPFHIGHKALLEEALKDHERVLIVFGSAQSGPTLKNPFTPAMREEMVRSALTDEQNEKLTFVSVRDNPYNDNYWLAEVRAKVLYTLKCEDTDIHLVGHFRDRSSFYLKEFPNWEFVEVTAMHGGISASTIRHLLLTEQKGWEDFLPGLVIQFIHKFRETETFANLVEEYKFILDYRAKTKFVNAPFDPSFMTTDAVVIQSGHVLVVRRKYNPGKGCLALPGGFVQPNETLEEGVIRELKEETKIGVDRAILRSCIKDRHMFDHPGRSMRGRTFTMAFFMPMSENLKGGLPIVTADDDAADAFWLPLSDVPLKEDEFFEDHAHIIRFFTKTL